MMGSNNKFKIGDRVKVTLDNGYSDVGTIARLYKNGRVGVREDRTGKYRVRSVGGDKYSFRGDSVEKIEAEQS